MKTNKKATGRRVLGILLCLVMVLILLPIIALANDPVEPTEGIVENPPPEQQQDDGTSGDYEITKTEHFDIYRAGSVTFEKVPVDASSKMPDDHMDSIEPYDYKGLKSFSTAYLPGFLADKYDVSVEESRERADQRCEGTLDAALRSSVKGYDTCTRLTGSTDLARGKVHYALMPVWMLNTKWQGKDFLFAMNGQTGKLVGDLPVSWGKFWGMFAGIAALLSIVGSIGATLLML